MSLIRPSLSARRAWIEIQWVWMPLALPVVALRKESVDRNYSARPKKIGRLLSLSARRAWIEIDFTGSDWVSEFRRSPQGERG